MFIPDELRPAQKPIDETTLSYIFNFLDEMLDVSFYNPSTERKKNFRKSSHPWDSM
jgi:hypothetical protein